MSDDKSTETNESGIKIFIGGWEYFFRSENIGPKIKNPQKFLEILVETIDCVADDDEKWYIEFTETDILESEIDSGIGLPAYREASDFVEREYYGHMKRFLKREYSEPADWVLVVVATREAVLEERSSYEFPASEYAELEASDCTHVFMEFRAWPTGYNYDETLHPELKWCECAD